MNFENWKWINESEYQIKGDTVTIFAPGHKDWFCNPVPNTDGTLDKPMAGAPVFYTEVAGDFAFTVKTTPQHKSMYDAGAIMVIESETRWAKLAFEASDFGTTAAVCVVTNEVSDDANGCDVDSDSMWLKLVRVGNVFSAHYSLDGETYHMVRLFRLPVAETVKVGLEAQCPVGDGGERIFSDILLENKTVANLRTGL